MCTGMPLSEAEGVVKSAQLNALPEQDAAFRTKPFNSTATASQTHRAFGEVSVA